MGIIGVEYQLMSGDEASVSADVGGGQTVGGGQEQYLVEFQGNENPSDRKFIAREGLGWNGATKIPPLYSVHNFDPWIFVIHKNAKPFQGGDLPSPLHWLVTVVYSSIVNPLELPPQVSWFSAATNEPVDIAKVLNPATGQVTEGSATNSSGEAVDPPITDEVDDLIYRTVFNQEFFNHTFASTLIGSLNSEVWKQFDKWKAKIKVYSAVERRAAGLNYVEVTAEIHIREDNWFQKVPDQGFRTLDGADPTTGLPKYTTIKDEEGNALSQPVLLDGFGQILPEGADPIILTYNARPSFDFNLLGLA